jgi:hypothetical protein
MPNKCQERIYSPLAFSTKFEDAIEILSLGAAAAKILDDVRFLTTSITSQSSNSDIASKIRSTASWLHNRVAASPEAPNRKAFGLPESDHMLNTIRLAALMYGWSIMHLKPISQFYQGNISDGLFSHINKVGLARWKELPVSFFGSCWSRAQVPRMTFKGGF